jgi:hypothetical protein
MIPAPRSSRPRQLNRVGVLVVSLVITAGGSDRAVQAEARTSAAPPPVPDAAALKRLAARLAPAELSADVTKLPASERSALIAILRAARLMDGLFMQQVWAGNDALLVALPTDATPLGRERLHALLQNKGPWLRLDGDRPFLPGVGAKPAAGTFYPAEATKGALQAWMQGLPAEARAQAGGFFTVIRRDPAGVFTVVPYSVAYQPELAQAAALLREAAANTTQPSLRRYLETRAASFLSNDYYPSDAAWMQLDASIEPTLGPYEVYEDGWFSAKAAFEAFVTLRDDAETARLARFASELQDLEDHLPIAATLRNPHLGTLAPIRVVNSIFGAGDANRGVQTAAFNLPNDEKIERELGTKRVMLKNVQEAKFRLVLLPISRVAIARGQRREVTFEAFFMHILMHELMHGLGPHEVIEAGAAPAHPRRTVREALQDTYGTIEEAKADVGGLWALATLMDKGVVERKLERALYSTFLASAFRSIRFGLNEAHGRAVALQLNTFLDAGAVTVAADGTFASDPAKMKQAVRTLTAELMTIQAAGDYTAAAALVHSRAVLRPAVKAVLDRLAAVPVDIEPRFTTAQTLLGDPAR